VTVGSDANESAQSPVRAKAQQRTRPALSAAQIDLVRTIVREVIATEITAVARIAWSPTEAAQAVGLPARRIYSAITRGELPAVRNGKHLRIPDRELRRWIGEQDDYGQPEHLTAS
jgi:excisionase family DNA binding protein